MSVILGIGHDRAASFETLLALVTQCLATAGRDPRDIGSVASIDRRREAGLVAELARHFSVPEQYFDVARLELETPRLRHPSPALFRRLGCHGVAEAAALAAAGAEAILILPKTTGAGVTCAIAERAANRR